VGTVAQVVQQLGVMKANDGSDPEEFAIRSPLIVYSIFEVFDDRFNRDLIIYQISLKTNYYFRLQAV
jgi:hypothetical protein